MSIGENIKKRRKYLGKTLEEVADIIGVSRQTMSRYETGVISNIPSDKVEAIARVLETTPSYLMGWSEQICDEPDSASAEKEKSDPARTDFCPSAQDWEQAISKMSKDELKALMDAAMEKFMDK